jgi:hypothetical protein
LFGLGELEGDRPICRYFKKNPTVAFTGNEILIRQEFCKEEEKKKEEDTSGPGNKEDTPKPPPPTPPPDNGRKSVSLRFNLPKGKVAGLLGILNYLQTNFGKLRLEVTGTDGHITEEDYEDKIMEAFQQMGIDVDEQGETQ